MSADTVAIEEAAEILGCPVEAVRRHVAAGRVTPTPGSADRLSRAEVEALASEVFAWRRHGDDPAPYWVTGQRAADLIGVSRSRLGQMADRHQVGYVRHQDGTRLYRRAELAAMASRRPQLGSALDRG